MKITTNMKGQIAMTKVELRALEKGYILSKPLFDTRYDLILDSGKELLRIQVKYGDGVMPNSTGSIFVKLGYENRLGEVFTYRKEEIDGLIVYIPKIDRVCFFPPKVFENKVKLSIRYVPSKNKQKKGIISAQDYFW